MGFGWLGGLMSLMPGYLEGQRQAIKDNWYDLDMFGKVQQQQDTNAFNEATFAPRVGNQFIGFNDNYYGMLDKGMQTAQAMAAHPGRMTYNRTMSAYSPQLSLTKVMTEGMTPFLAMQQPYVQSGQQAPQSISDMWNSIWGGTYWDNRPGTYWDGSAPVGGTPSAIRR